MNETQTPNEATLLLYEEVISKGMDGDVQPFMETLLRVQPKVGQLVPFHFNPTQQKLFNNSTPADIILKAGQMGITTLKVLEYLTYCILQPGVQALIVAQRDDTVTNLFDIAHRAILSMPEEVRPKLLQSSAHVIEIDHSATVPGMTSIFEAGTSNSDSFGRGRPTHYALFTEVGFYDEDAVKMVNGIITRMPKGESQYTMESTANGMDNYFHKTYTAAEEGKGELTAHFFPWFEAPEYSIPVDLNDRWGQEIVELTESEKRLISRHGLNHSQIRWRRWQQARLLTEHESADFFKQENPETSSEAFLPIGSAIFRSENITAAAYTVREPYDDDGVNSRWVDPIPERPYLISIDQASGEVRDIDEKPTDFQVLTVWESVQLEQTHRVRHQEMTHRAMAKHAVRLARLYNGALVVFERNLAKYGLVEMIQEEGYFNIYVHNDGKYGYPVTVATKPVLKDQVIEMLKARGSTTIHSENLIRELRNFRNLKAKGKAAGMGAGPGGHDDELITFFFACDPNVRSQAYSTRQQGTSDPNVTASKTVFADEVI